MKQGNVCISYQEQGREMFSFSHEGKQAGKIGRKIRIINGFSVAGLWDFPCSPFPSCISLQSNHVNSKNRCF